jgi:hypothetical protein
MAFAATPPSCPFFLLFLQNRVDGSPRPWFFGSSQDKATRLNVPLGFWVFPGDNRSGRFFFLLAAAQPASALATAFGKPLTPAWVLYGATVILSRSMSLGSRPWTVVFAMA